MTEALIVAVVWCVAAVLVALVCGRVIGNADRDAARYRDDP